MRRLAILAAALLLSLPLCAQETQTAPQKQAPQQKKASKKKAAPQPSAPHQGASKEQIRKFNELQKKQQQK